MTGRAVTSLTDLSRGELIPDSASSPFDLMHAVEVQMFLMKLQSGLSARQRMILFLRYHCEYTFAEIGETLGLTVDAAKMAEIRIRRQLKKDLAALGLKSSREIL